MVGIFAKTRSAPKQRADRAATGVSSGLAPSRNFLSVISGPDANVDHKMLYDR